VGNLRELYPIGVLIDPQERLLKTIVFRKVDSFYSRGENHPKFRVGRVSLAKIGDPSQVRVKPPIEEIAERETRAAIEAAIADQSPHRREAVRAKLGLGDVRSARELARDWGAKHPQNVYKLAAKGIKELKKSLARFA